jgi:hypothetical protein
MKLSVVAAAVVFSILVILSGPAGAGTLDQSHAVQPYYFGAAVDSTYNRAQTFTVGLNGKLDRVELQVYREATVTTPLTIQLRKTVGGAPDISAAGLLATLNLAATSVPTTSFSTTFVGADLGAQAFPVTSGQLLSILLTSTEPANNWYLWTTSDSAATPPAPQYTGGQGFYRFVSDPIQATGTQDSGFRTFVSVPEPGMGVLAGLLCVGLRRRGRRVSQA